jgi:hypothetical protein
MANPLGRNEGLGRKYLSNKVKSHAKRKRARASQAKEREAGGRPYDVHPSTRLKHTHHSSAVDTEVKFEDIPISLPGYIGLRSTKEQSDRAEYTLDDLIGEGSRFKFKLQKWDGR